MDEFWYILTPRCVNVICGIPTFRGVSWSIYHHSSNRIILQTFEFLPLKSAKPSQSCTLHRLRNHSKPSQSCTSFSIMQNLHNHFRILNFMQVVSNLRVTRSLTNWLKYFSILVKNLNFSKSKPGESKAIS